VSELAGILRVQANCDTSLSCKYMSLVRDAVSNCENNTQILLILWHILTQSVRIGPLGFVVVPLLHWKTIESPSVTGIYWSTVGSTSYMCGTRTDKKILIMDNFTKLTEYFITAPLCYCTSSKYGVRYISNIWI